jgi:hypothetical protein
MASGHVNRTQRPNTWLLRPGLRREESPCQRGAVHTWHKEAGDEFELALARIMHHAAQFRTPDGGRASPSLFQGGVSQLAVQRA